MCLVKKTNDANVEKKTWTKAKEEVHEATASIINIIGFSFNYKTMSL